MNIWVWKKLSSVPQGVVIGLFAGCDHLGCLRHFIGFASHESFERFDIPGKVGDGFSWFLHEVFKVGRDSFGGVFLFE
jgi:hypothetical protein